MPYRVIPGLAATLQGHPWQEGEALSSLLAAFHAGLCPLGLLRALLGTSGPPKDSWPLPCPGHNVLTTKSSDYKSQIDVKFLKPQGTTGQP